MIKQLSIIRNYFCLLQINSKATGLQKFQHQHKFPVLESVNIPSLSQQDIINFDQFYNTQTVSEFRDFKGKRVLIKKVYQPNITQILQLKIGDNFESLINFLEFRDEFITDLELAYCLMAIKQHHRHYLAPLCQTYLVKINYLIEIGKLKFYSLQSIRDVLEVHNCRGFLDEASIIICIDYLLSYAQHLERSIEQKEEIDESHFQSEMNLVYETLHEVCKVKHKKNHAFESLMKIRKILTRKLKLLPLQDILGFLSLSSKHKNILFTEVPSIQKMEDFLLQNYNILELDEKIETLQSLASFPLRNSVFASKFLTEIQAKTTEFKIQEFGMLIAAFSQFTFPPDYKDSLWKFMQGKFLTYHLVEDDHLVFSKIIQVFGQNQQGTQQFWQQIQDIKSNFSQKIYADDFTLLQNQLRLGYVDMNLIDCLSSQEFNELEFKYLNKYSLEQKINVFQIFTQAYTNIPNLTEIQQSAYSLLINQLRQLIFNNDNDRDEIYKNVYLRLKYVLILNMALDIVKKHPYKKTKRSDIKLALEKQKHSIAQELQLAQRKIDRLINKGKLNTYESIALYAILSSRQEKNARLLDLLADHIQVNLQQMTSFDEIIRSVHLGYRINMTQPQFWITVLEKIQSTIGAYKIIDLIIIRDILSIYLLELDQFLQFKFSIIQMCNQQDFPLYQIRRTEIPFKQCGNLDDLLRLLMVEIELDNNNIHH